MCFRHITPQDLASQQVGTVVIGPGAGRFRLTDQGTWYNVAIGHLSHEELSEQSFLMRLHNPMSYALLEQWEGLRLNGILNNHNLQWTSNKLREVGLDFDQLMHYRGSLPTLTAEQTNKFALSQTGWVFVAVDVYAEIVTDDSVVYCWYNGEWQDQYGPAELRGDGRYVVFLVKSNTRAFRHYTPEQLEQVIQDYVENYLD